jgi:hypothetical protein
MDAARRLGCIVEGQGDQEAVPVLVRRIAASLEPPLTVQIPICLRIPKSRLLKPGELERYIELAARKIASPGAILIVLDSDDDCPAQRGPELLRRAALARRDFSLAVVLPKREFEAWFLASAESLRGVQGLAPDLQPPPDPEDIRGAKEWIGERMAGGRKYVETLHQSSLAAQMDMVQARQSDSFDKFYRDVVRLLTNPPGAGTPLPDDNAPPSHIVRRLR